MQDKIIKLGTKIYWKYSFLRPFLAPIHRFLFIKPKFSGWGMQTEAELPWIDEYNGEIFRKANEDIKKEFEFTTKNATGTTSGNLDTLLWRHWIVSYAVKHAIEFAGNDNLNFVECGVGDGISAFFALREMKEIKKPNFRPYMHLYDSWNYMREEDLMEDELKYAGRYSHLSIDRTKKNLEEFGDIVIFHQGYVPESFTNDPKSPESIIYLSIDLNSVKPTLSALEFFFPRLIRGGVILFDDYGQVGYADTRKVIDRFFSDKPGILFKLPTSQAIYYR